MAQLERSIAGPFYFGSKPSPVDFFLCNEVDMAQCVVLNALKAKTGVDVFAPYPKVQAVVAGIRSLPSYKVYDIPPIPEAYVVSDDFIADY